MPSPLFPPRDRNTSSEVLLSRIRKIVVVFLSIAAIISFRSSRPNDQPYSLQNQELKQQQILLPTNLQSDVVTDDLREIAVMKAKQTPGWGIRNENEIYMLASDVEYDRLRFLYDINPSKMPLPYQSILSPETVSRLQLDDNAGMTIAKSYTDDQVIQTLGRFEHVGFILRYSGTTDEFIIYAPKRYNWSRVDQIEAYSSLTKILRKEYYFRFAAGQPDFSVIFSTGDSLKMDCGCLSTPIDRESNPSPSDESTNSINFQQRFQPSGKEVACDKNQLAPILQFGSGFVNPNVVPSLITMPIWPHLKCFETFHFKGKVCNKFSPASLKNKFGIYFAEEDEKTAYDKLMPQIIWRGSDYPFLNCRPGGSKWGVNPSLDVPGPNNPEGILSGLMHLYDQLSPRWKAVTVSLQAELGTKNHNDNEATPWVDFKFTNKDRPGESQRWNGFVKNGANIVADSYLDAKRLSSFRYHIDFGGGGGTTWRGTHTKLALPGVLFHHETPTYDYYHEDLIPFVHYIPVSTELGDLREKFEWAEAHPMEAQKIAEAGTAFARYMTSTEYWKRAFDRFFVKRLNSVIEAYRPMHAFKGEKDFMSYAESKLGFPLEGICKCDGRQMCTCKGK